ncbi:MAG: Rrf2 family transcriptional regulator [bacterium]
MNTSSRCIVATHVMAAMAVFKLATGKFQTLKSDSISASVNTNPVVIRRILGMLRKAGLVVSLTGPEGGSMLARDPKTISLLEIYDAVEDGCLFHLHYSQPSQECPIGYNIQGALGGVFSAAEKAVKKVLAQKTLADIAIDIMERSGISEKLARGFSADEVREKFVFQSGKLIEKSLVNS